MPELEQNPHFNGFALFLFYMLQTFLPEALTVAPCLVLPSTPCQFAPDAKLESAICKCWICSQIPLYPGQTKKWVPSMLF